MIKIKNSYTNAMLVVAAINLARDVHSVVKDAFISARDKARAL